MTFFLFRLLRETDDGAFFFLDPDLSKHSLSLSLCFSSLSPTIKTGSPSPQGPQGEGRPEGRLRQGQGLQVGRSSQNKNKNGQERQRLPLLPAHGRRRLPLGLGRAGLAEQDRARGAVQPVRASRLGGRGVPVWRACGGARCRVKTKKKEKKEEHFFVLVHF